MPNELPEGFVLDAPSPKSNALPEGFQLDPPKKPKPVAGFWSSLGHEMGTGLDLPKALNYSAIQNNPRYTQEEQDKARREFLTAREPNARQLDWKDVHSAGDFLTYGLEGAGHLAGYVAAPMAIGAVSGPMAVGTVPTAFMAQHEVTNLESQARAQEADITAGKKARDVSIGKSLVASGAETAMDIFGGKLFTSIPGVSKMMGKMPILRDLVGESVEPLEGETAEEAAKRASKEAQDKIINARKNGELTYKKGIAYGVAKGVGFAVPQSLASTILDRWQSGESNDVFNDKEAANAWKDALLQGAVLGVTLGVGEGAFHTHAERKQAADILGQRKVEEKAAAEAAAEAAEEEKKAPKGADSLLAQARDVLMAHPDATWGEYLNALKTLTDENGEPIPHSRATSLLTSLIKKDAGDLRVQLGKADPKTGIRVIKNRNAEEGTTEAAPVEHTTEDLVAEPATEAEAAETRPADPTSHEGTVDPNKSLAEDDAAGKNADDVSALAPGDATTPPKEDSFRDFVDKLVVASSKEKETGGGKDNAEVSDTSGGSGESDTGDNAGGTGGGVKLPTLPDTPEEPRIGRTDDTGVGSTEPSTEATDDGKANEQPSVAAEPPPIIPPVEGPPKAEPPKPAEVEPVHDKAKIESDLKAMADADGVIKGSAAAEYVRMHSPNAFHRYVAGLVSKMLGHFERAGFEVRVRFEDPNKPTKYSPSIKNGSGGVAHFQARSTDKNPNRIDVHLAGDSIRSAKRTVKAQNDMQVEIPVYPHHAKDPTRTAGHDTILHELIHAVTMHAIHYGKYFAENNEALPASRQSKSYLVGAYKDLDALYKHVMDRINKIPDNKLTAAERTLREGSNMFQSAEEFMTWALSDETAANYLATIPYKSGGKLVNAWRTVVDTVAKILGIDPAKKTALNELLRVSEKYIGKDTTPQVLALRNKYTKEPTYMTDAVRAQRKAAPEAPRTPEEWEQSRADELEAKSVKGKIVNGLRDLWENRSKFSFDKVVTLLQNEWRPLKTVERKRELANSNIIGGDKATNIYTNLIGAMDRGASLISMHLNPLFQQARKEIRAFAKNNDLSWNEALARLDGMRISLHEPERRRTVYVRDVPMKTTPRAYKDGNGNTVMMSPADRRQRILDKIADAKVSAADKEKLEQALHKMVFEKDAQGNYVNLDENGHSPSKGKGAMSIKEDSPEYNVVGGYDSAFIKELSDRYKDSTANGANPEIDRIFALLKEMENKGSEFDRSANYWTDYTDGIVAAYGWKNYVPLKGLGEQEARFELSGKRNGVSGEHAEAPNAFESRESEADNTILQTMVDASRSAARAGRKDVTKILKNLIKTEDGMGIKGKLVKTLTAQDRYENKIDMSEYKKKGNFFHYMPNGDIEVYSLTQDPEILESIRRPFEELSPVNKFLNGMTGFMGKQHTRYNLAFAPMNYIKHTLSNAYNMASHAGLGTAIDYLGHTIGNTGNMYNAVRFAKALYSGDTVSLDKMRNSSNPFFRNMIEYMEEGGRTTYGQTYSITSKMDYIKKSVGQGKIMHTAQEVTHYFDAYQDMFDLTSRTSAYGVLKQKLMQDGLSEPQAKELAAAQAKEVTNYRLIGKYGRSAGGLFMFFRPAASSSVAAIDALRPAFQNVKSVLAKYPESVLKDPVKKKAIIDNHMQLQQNSRRLGVALIGAGAALYSMAYFASDKDEQGRNRVASDDKARWTRYMRLPILGDKANGFFQLPWGFGLGGLGALGAQLAALSYGHQSMSKAAGNIVNIAAESFLPLQPSHISPTDNLFAFALDTVMPSGLRPWVEYAMNRDDMGNEIYNGRQGKYSDVYTGGDHIPQGYKDLARMVYRLTDYKLEISPNTLYFFATHYFDAIGRITNMGYDLKLMADGNKHFDYKRDIPFTDSFVGTYSNVDARQWQEIQKELDSKSRTLNTLKKTDSNAYVKYMTEHPNEQFIVNNYHHMVNAQLKKLAAQRLNIQLQPDENIPPLQREEMVKQIRLHENTVKANLVARYHEMGVDP